MHLNQVTVPCTDYDASVSFYKTLGLRQIVDSPPRYARFETANGATFSIHSAAVSDNPGFVIYFEVDDVDEALEAMTAAGYEIIKGPIERADGQRAFYVYDPEGNRLEFATKSGIKPSNRVVDEMGYSTDGDQ